MPNCWLIQDLKNLFFNWPQTTILSISTSWVTRITGMSYHTTPHHTIHTTWHTLKCKLHARFQRLSTNELIVLTLIKYWKAGLGCVWFNDYKDWLTKCHFLFFAFLMRFLEVFHWHLWLTLFLLDSTGLEHPTQGMAQKKCSQSVGWE
jgi:hypothetical protein